MAAAGTRLRIRVSPGARASALLGRHGDAWKLCVSAPRESGRANEAVLRLLAAELGVRRSDVRLVGGATGKDKLVAITGLSLDEAERRLAAAGPVA